MGLETPQSLTRHYEEETIKIILGTRKSDLALVQTRTIISKLGEVHHNHHNPYTFEIATTKVTGDVDKLSPFTVLSKLTGGSDVGKSLWTNELEADLVAGKVDILVHCLKDMPTTLPSHCLLGAIPERDDCSDADPWWAQARAVGQGALGLEIHQERPDLLQLVLDADHKPSRWRGLAERAMLRHLQGGCSSPVGVWSAIDKNNSNELRLRATVLDVDGTSEVVAEDKALVESNEEAENLGISVAKLLIGKGARELLPKKV